MLNKEDNGRNREGGRENKTVMGRMKGKQKTASPGEKDCVWR